MRRLCVFLFAVIFLFLSIAGATTVKKKRVLFIASYHPAFPTFFEQQRGLHDVLDAEGVYFDTEFMDSKRFPLEVIRPRFLRQLREKLHDVPPYDLILTGDDNAFDFVRQYRKELFPDIPVVFFGLNNVELAQAQNNELGFTGVVEAVSIRETLELISQLHPEVSEVVTITDATTSGQSDLIHLESVAGEIKGLRIRNYELSKLTYEELFARLAQLNEDQAVLLLSGYYDCAGERKDFYELMKGINACLARPLYHLWYHGIGTGVLGGKVVSHYKQSSQAARMAVQVLTGTSVDVLPVQMRSPNQYVFDFDKLQAFEIDQRLLPQGAVVLNDVDRMAAEHRARLRYAVGALVVLGCMAIGFAISAYRYWFMLAQISQYKAAWDQTRDGVVIVSKKGIVEYCNRAWAQMHGYDPLELKKAHLSTFYEPVYYEHTVLPLKERVLRTGEGTASLEHRCKDGSAFFGGLSMTLVQARARFPKKMVAILRDVTEERSLQEQLSQRQKMESIGLLAGGLAHDLNNLLTPIMGYAELLGEEHREDGKSLIHARHILQSAERAKGLLSQLLAFSRKQALVVKVVDLVELTESMAPMLRALMPEAVSVSLRLDRAPCCVLGDRHRLERVLLNLVVNARDVMSSGGDIRIVVERVRLTKPTDFYNGALAPDEYVCLSVSDQGAGIHERDFPRLFEPFFTTKPVGKGSGLGLAVVDGIVRQHGGAIDVISEHGQGTEFKIYFKGRTSADEVSSLTEGNCRKEDPFLLVVADNAAEVDDLVSVLKSGGYAVKGFMCPKAALKWGRHIGQPVSLLLTDVIAPTLNGPDLFDQMRELHPDLKVLFFSEYSATVLSGVLHLENDFEIMRKSPRGDYLLEKVRSVLDAG